MTTLLSLKDVSVERGGTPVLHAVSLALETGERLAIVGPNGAGKTTLLRTIVGLEHPVSGEVCLFDVVCRSEADFRRLRPRVGFLFQDSDDQLFCPTVLEDICFGPLNLGASQIEAEARAREVLERLGIASLTDRVSHRLSGGEKRLVCLAGLLAMRPDALILDEPTNGVDATNRERLLTALMDFPGPILLVSHDQDFVASLATRTVTLRAGRFVA
jgi:ABC-type cobalt transport system, ATPase component